MRIAQRRPAKIFTPGYATPYYVAQDLTWQEFVHLMCRQADRVQRDGQLLAQLQGKYPRNKLLQLGVGYKVYAAGMWGHVRYVLGGVTDRREPWNMQVLRLDWTDEWCVVELPDTDKESE